VRFALLKVAPAATASLDSALELMLNNGERLAGSLPVSAGIC
jgi:hypothetical protein